MLFQCNIHKTSYFLLLFILQRLETLASLSLYIHLFIYLFFLSTFSLSKLQRTRLFPRLSPWQKTLLQSTDSGDSFHKRWKNISLQNIYDAEKTVRMCVFLFLMFWSGGVNTIKMMFRSCCEWPWQCTVVRATGFEFSKEAEPAGWLLRSDWVSLSKNFYKLWLWKYPNSAS